MKVLMLFFILTPMLAQSQSAPAYFSPSESNPKPKVIFFGSAALSAGSSSADIASTLTASGKFTFIANPAGKFFLTAGANLLNVNPAKAKRDSVDFNSLMFPETGNFGVYVSPCYRIDLPGNPAFSLVPLYEFAYRKYTVDSPIASFKVFNHTLGARVQWRYAPSEKDTLMLGLTLYNNWFEVSAEDVKKFTQLVNDAAFGQLAKENKPLTVRSFGVKFTVQYNTMIFFADFRKNSNTNSLTDGDPFKGTVVNIGFSTLIKLGSF